MTDTGLDQQLKHWAARHTPHDTRALEEKISSLVASVRPLPRKRWTHAHTFLAGAAAAAVVMFVSFVDWMPREARQFARLLKEEEKLSAQRRASMTKIFNETERLFGANLQWIAEEKNNVELGLSETPSAAEPMILRVTVVHKNEAGEWRRVWSAEVVARDKSKVVLNVPGVTEIKLDVRSHESLNFGKAKSVMRIAGNGTEYRVLQTIAPTTGEES